MTNNHNIKVKKWNFIALILCGIEIVLSIIDLPGSLNPDKTFYQKLGNDGMEIFNQLNSMPIKIFAVLNLLIVIAFFVVFFNANKSLKSKKNIKKYPYFLNLVWTVIVVLFTILTTSDLGSITDDSSTKLGMLLFTVFFILLLKIPIIMVLINIFKLDIGEDNE
ncbi:hypothetical protein LIT97_13685 (plasmid) [Enterococcus faecalis]|uniref:hypothetical protein n=1 Tax=Enterococcus faecalis TaxID=1351 RepID=UPI00174A2A25|nr:hypothetical protein [Enterococcus faecalis]EGO8851274.1 hypothetical protein [Enterococcus faecalis]EGO9032028.1 hypothetical protein [Enterococcus faecalis]EGO9035024.1 hypothetical protein [Enterococcus faecalis]EHU5032089.1 hypothetical protein [Enterococcus faecalis]EJC3729288.1 hypothetical protein [Enterococcus faecalis]